MIRKIKNTKNLKIRTQFALLIFAAGLISLILFSVLWKNKWLIGRFFSGTDLSHTLLDNPDFMTSFFESAQFFDIPESENDTEGIQALDPLFDLADEYTSIYIYSGTDGYYRAGRYASVMDTKAVQRIFEVGYNLTGIEGEDDRLFAVPFRNGLAIVVMYNYKRAMYTQPYFIGCLLLCVLLFFVIVLVFISRKMRSVLMLEEEILNMSSGDLSHPVPAFGDDEIGILAKELDHLRLSLNDTIVKEQESRKANQDLITALSHDLRTPLTILTGYLEVLRLKRTPVTQDEYLERCLKKTEDIKELTDRMFEYALVSEENETPEITWISTDFIRQCLQENSDFIRLAGFTPVFLMQETERLLESDKTMLKRIFNNLFSNLLKYGDKRHPVNISGDICRRAHTLIISVSNHIKQEHDHESGSNIGLNNVRKMMQILGGTTTIEKENQIFTIKLGFPLS